MEDKDINKEEIAKKLTDIKKYYEKLSALYSIKDDLVEITDKRHALAVKLNEHIGQNQKKYNELFNEFDTNSKVVSNSLEQLKTIEELDKYINGVIPGSTQTRSEKLTQILSDENLNAFSKKIYEIEEGWKAVLDKGDKEFNLVDDIKDSYAEIINFYNQLFESKGGNPSRSDELDSIYTDFKTKYEQAIKGYQKTEEGEVKFVKSYFEDMKDSHNSFKDHLKELKTYYDKVFGNEEGTKGLKQELDERLVNLKEIEEEARKVIDLSSDAGLSSGFHMRGNKARFNKLANFTVFVASLAAIGKLNFETIDWANLGSLDLTSIIIRAIINLPFIWIALVANINLNKYSRLEEEYAHKESLARSFERYKTEIEKLEEKDGAKSKELLISLMTINIEAFKVNPAETMEKAKSDMPNISAKGLKKENID